MITTLIAKFAAPALIGVALGIGGVIGLQKATKQYINLTCPEIDYEKLPKCPQCPATLGSEFEKVKGKYITLNLNQTYQIHMESDTLILKAIGDEVQKRMDNLKLSRCK